MDRYNKEVLPALQKEFGRDNRLSIPRLQKIVVSMGVGKATQEKKRLDAAAKATGLVVLELALEAGAVLAVDLGVASGSVSAMLGVYLRLEGDGGSLTGYFRLRGEVDVLGLISASIELYLELSYDFATGKMVGSASLTVKVEVLFFSTSVTISAERQFAGSNGDPTFVDVMGLEADGTSPDWSEYCLAFAGA
jgi:hypothetical protein